MKIGFDISPLQTEHGIRGVGTYTQNLQKALLRYYPQNTYVFLEKRNFNSEKLDVIHYPFFDPFFLTLPWIKHTKTVITVHDLIPLVFPKHFPSGIKGRLKWLIQKKLLDNADAIITDSLASKKDIQKLLGFSSERIHVVLLAAAEDFKDLNLSPEEENKHRRRLGLPQRFLLYVGDGTWNKNLPRIIQAVLATELPLILVGKSIVNKNIDTKNSWNKDLLYVQDKIDNQKIIAKGYVSMEDLVYTYNLAEILLMPSLYEGFGLPVLEAMASGCPIITSKSGSLEEVGGDSVYYVDPLSEKNIVDGIKNVSQDQKLREVLIAKGFKRITSFSWKKTAAETIKIYESIIK